MSAGMALPQPPGPLVQMRRVNYAYPGATGPVPVLHDVSLGIAQGEFVAVLGASGSGKTTLLNLLGGLDKPTSGVISVDDRDITRCSERELERYRQHTVGFVFQFFNLLPSLTAIENVRLGLEAMEPAPRDSEERAARLLRAVGLAGKEARFPNQLSGGEQQRVAIARALAKSAPLILADEPTGNLDEDTAVEVMNLFQRVVREERATLLLITHDPGVAKRADRVLLLNRGHIEVRNAECSPREPVNAVA